MKSEPKFSDKYKFINSTDLKLDLRIGFNYKCGQTFGPFIAD